MKYDTRKSKKKTVSFRIDQELLLEFRLLCSAYDVKQVGIIESAMKEVVTDLKKRLEEKQNDR
jgi:hypothetical protein